MSLRCPPSVEVRRDHRLTGELIASLRHEWLQIVTDEHRGETMRSIAGAFLAGTLAGVLFALTIALSYRVVVDFGF